MKSTPLPPVSFLPKYRQVLQKEDMLTVGEARSRSYEDAEKS
jgi:hypothetical protein